MCDIKCNYKVNAKQWNCANCVNKDIKPSFVDMCNAINKELEDTICDLIFVGEYEDKLRIELRANINPSCVWNWECQQCGNKYDYAVYVCPNCNIESPAIKVDKVVSFLNLVFTIDGIYDTYKVEYIGNNIYLTYKKCEY